MFKAGQHVQVVKDIEAENLDVNSSWIGSVGKFVAYRDGCAIVAFTEDQIPQDGAPETKVISGEYDAWFMDSELQKYPMPRKYLHEYLLPRANHFNKHHMIFKVTHSPMSLDGPETPNCKVLYMHAQVEKQDPFMIVKFPDGTVHQVKSYNCYPQVPGWLAHLNWLVQWYGWESGANSLWQDIRNSACLLLSIAFQFYPTGNDPY